MKLNLKEFNNLYEITNNLIVKKRKLSDTKKIEELQNQISKNLKKLFY